MATANPFDLLGDNDHEDPSQVVAVQLQQQKAAPKKAPAATQAASQKQQPLPAKLPSKPLPPTQAVREAKNDTGAGRGGVRGGGRGYGRGRGGGFNRDSGSTENTFNALGDDSEVGKSSERGRGSYSGGPRGRGGRRGGFSNGEAGGDGDRPPRRQYERRSGTGRGNEIKREGSGRGNWGGPTDEVFAQEAEDVVNATEKILSPEQQPGEEDSEVANKEGAVAEPEEKEPEDKEMTLVEYEKVVEEKRKALQALKTEERKVDLDKEFKSMQQLSSKKNNEDVFIKLGSEKEKRRDIADKDEKTKKVSINEFLKPAEGERYYSPSGRGRGRGGRGSRGGFAGGNLVSNNAVAPSIEDQGQFPTLSAK